MYKINPELQSIIHLLQENIFIPKVEDIIEVTYAYSENGFNETLFSNFWGYKEGGDLDEILEWTKDKLTVKVSLIDYALDRLDEIEHTESVNFVMKSALYAKNALMFAYEGAVFEAEKAGYEHNMTEKQIHEQTKRVESYDAELFGEKVTLSKKEIKKALEHVASFYFNLQESDQRFFDDFLDKVNVLHDTDYKYRRHTRVIVPLEDEEAPKYFTQEKYIRIFENVFKMLDIKKGIKIDSRTSIYDWTDDLYFPKTLTKLDRKRVLKLVAHEIEGHYVNMENSKRIFWEMQWAGKLEKEEWLAMFLETLLYGDQVLILRPWFTFLKTLMWELLSYDELQKWLEIIYKAKSLPFNKSLWLRPKRNYSLHEYGGQHKDISYSRGLEKVVSYITDGHDFYDLFLWRIDFADFDTFKKIKHFKEKTEDNFKVITPVFIAEFLKYLITYDITPKKGSLDALVWRFGAFLVNKYKFLDRNKQENALKVVLYKHFDVLEETLSILKEK